MFVHNQESSGAHNVQCIKKTRLHVYRFSQPSL